jgi:hypothetical protein
MIAAITWATRGVEAGVDVVALVAMMDRTRIQMILRRWEDGAVHSEASLAKVEYDAHF